MCLTQLTRLWEIHRWVAYHGLALNVAIDMSPYSLITPCGISDRPVGTVQKSLLDAFGPESADELMDEEMLLQEYRVALVDRLEHVFCRRSVEASIGDVFPHSS